MKKRPKVFRKWSIKDIRLICSFPGGRIDHGHHAGQAVRALRDALAMADACETAMNMTNRGN